MTDDLVGGGAGQTLVHPDDLVGLRPRWISTQGQLDEVERDNLLRGTRWAVARRDSLEGVLDDSFLRRLHQRCFGEVWDWAGQYRFRTTNIGVEPQTIAASISELMADAAVWFADATAASAQADLAWLHHRLVSIHPFPNGNGRTARLHADVVAARIGVEAPTWGAGRSAARSAYLAALRAADSGDAELLAEFMWS